MSRKQVHFLFLLTAAINSRPFTSFFFFFFSFLDVNKANNNNNYYAFHVKTQTETPSINVK